MSIPETQELTPYQQRERELDALLAQIPGMKPDPAPEPPVPSIVPPPTIPSPAPDAVPSAPAPPAVPESPAQPSPKPQDTWTAEEWKREAEFYKKRHANDDRALTRAKKIEETVGSQNEALESLKADLAAIREQIASALKPALPAKPAAPTIYRPEADDPDFVTLNPEVAKRLERIAQATETRLSELREEQERSLAELKAKDAERQAHLEHERAKAFESRWFDDLRSRVPNVDEYKPGGSKGEAIGRWAEAQVPEYRNAILNPLGNGFTAAYVADVIRRFEQEMKPADQPPVREPSLAEIANRALLGTAPVAVASPTPERKLTPVEMQNISKLVDAASRAAVDAMQKGKLEVARKYQQEADELLAAYNRTLTST